MNHQTEGANGSVMTSVGRTAALLDAVAAAPREGVGVTTAAQLTGIPKAAAHRILKSLTLLELLSFDDGNKLYSLGPATLRIGLSALRQLDVPRVARPHLEKLVEATSETCTLSVRQGNHRMYVDQLLSPQEVKMTVTLGRAIPLYAGSSSKAILSTFTPAELDAYLSGATLSPLTPNTVTDEEQLKAELSDIARIGYAASRGERQIDAGSVASPVFQADGSVFGAISVCGPLDRFNRKGLSALGRLVRETASEISRSLGYRGIPGYLASSPAVAGNVDRNSND